MLSAAQTIADTPPPFEAGVVPGFSRDARGRPVVPADSVSLFAYGDLIRRTEQLILDQYARGLVSGTTHTCLGQEICAMAVVRALDHPDDAVLSNHRNHGHFLSYSGEFVGLVAEIMGRDAGVVGGRGGSQHLAWGHFHSNGIQGGMTGIGAGLSLARRKSDSPGIVAVMIGDGTLGQGMLYEAMNLASVWGTRFLVVVENNAIAQTTSTDATIGGDILARGAAFGLATWRLDDTAPDFVERAADVVRSVRASGRPGFLVVDTRRLGPHSKGDDLRDDTEKAAIATRDPLAALGRRLSDAQRRNIEARNAAYVDWVRDTANASPEARYEEPPEHIFQRQSEATAVSYPAAAAPGRNVRLAINAALRELLATDDKVLLIGEDLHDPYGGAFKVTQGLSTDFPGRVISTPISEAGITGATIGLAIAGYKPVLEIMFADFLTLCLDQLYNHAVKFPGVFPEMSVPLVIRTPSGGRRGYGPTHSQSPENLLTAVPGLTVVFPSHRHDVARALVDSVERWPYPTIFFEHKLLYGETVDPADYIELPSHADDIAAHLFPTLVRPRTAPDAVVVSYGGMLPVVEKAVARLESEEELAIEILALALLSPLPKQILLDRLLPASAVLIAEESHHEFGVGAEIAAILMEAGYGGRVARVGAPPVPIMSARSLERQILPDEDRLFDEILDLL